MLSYYRPARVIEVGSGFSSAVMLDLADRYSLDTRFTFIEPNPERLRELLRPTDERRTCVVPKPVQDVDVATFAPLEARDFLFVDSSHVAKAGSDLVHLIYRIIPSLKVGCVIHFHDIFYPETYPKAWLQQGISWNETFIVRAFLMFNSAFRIILFNPFLQKHCGDVLTKWNARVAEDAMSSIWIERVA